MFTGIITDVGAIAALNWQGDLHARIRTAYTPESMDLGASIACNGVCLTVIDRGTRDDGGNWFDVTLSAESVNLTTAKDWTVGTALNLERALKVGDELGGHIVSGHVDGTAEIVEMRDEGDSTRFTFDAPSALARFIAPKGSVALDGTSLTVNEVEGTRFGVNIIPHTKTVTTWGTLKTGDKVNLEIDTLARYVARLVEVDRTQT
jgi:riboflavin synthase